MVLVSVEDGIKISEVSVCRVIILDSSRARLVKVLFMLDRVRADEWRTNHQVKVEYLPCIPVFGSYQDQEGGHVRYLMRVDFLGIDARLNPPGTLLPYFEDENATISAHQQKNSLKAQTLLSFHQIAGMVAGSGIECAEDLKRVVQFLETMFNSKSLPTQMIQPNDPFNTIHEELSFFKSLSMEEKEEANKKGLMGPGKMALFVERFAEQLIASAVERMRLQETPCADAPNLLLTDPASSEACEEPLVSTDLVVNRTKNRYLCRKCRCDLFGTDYLEDPPHQPSKHLFSFRKQRASGGGGGNCNVVCQSYFLRSYLSWMGDMSQMEGKIICPRCNMKVGNWSWAGAQCSCGTWVVPAIQIPCSRVDVVLPQSVEGKLPVGTIISPILQP